MRFRKGGASAGPEREVPPRGMAHHDGTRRLYGEVPGKERQMVHSSSDVLKGTRPAAARNTDPAVLDVPGRDPFAGESLAEMPGVFEAVARAPEAAVDIN